MLDNPTLIDLAPFTRNLKTRRRVCVHLSPRERQVMQLVADGMTLEAIASRLHISLGVVRLYIGQVHRKLNVQSTPCAVGKCVELKLIKISLEG